MINETRFVEEETRRRMLEAIAQRTNAKAVIRTRDFAAYSNVLLVPAGGARWHVEKPSSRP